MIKGKMSCKYNAMSCRQVMEINKNHKLKLVKQTGLNLIMVAANSLSPLVMLLSVKGLWPQLSFVALRNICVLFLCTSLKFMAPFEIYHYWSQNSVEMAFFRPLLSPLVSLTQIQKSYHVITSVTIVQWVILLLWGTLLQYVFKFAEFHTNKIQFMMWY